MGEALREAAGVHEVRLERRCLGQAVEVLDGGRVPGDVSLVQRLELRNLGRVSGRKAAEASVSRTISRNSCPTWSSPVPPSNTDPNALSSRAVKSSENFARSATLLKMIRTSSGLIGGSRKELPEESDAVECVRDDDADSGGVGGTECSDAGFPADSAQQRALSHLKEQEGRTVCQRYVNVSDETQVLSVGSLRGQELEQSMVALRSGAGARHGQS